MSVPPRPERRRVEHRLHGETRLDDYAWLRDRDDPAVLRHLEAENDHTAAKLEHLGGLRKRLYEEMLGRIQETDTSAPLPHGAYDYYTRTEAGRGFKLHCRTRRGTGSEEMLLDENTRAEGHSSYRLGAIIASPSHRRLAFTEDDAGSERYTLYVVDLATGRALIEPVAGLKESIAWVDDDTLLYTVPDAMDRPYRAMRLRLGGHPELLHEESDERFYMGVGRTRDGMRAVVVLGSKTSSELRYLPTDRPDAPLQVLAKRRPNVLYYAAHHPQGWWVWSNDAGVNFRLLVAEEGQPTEAWEEVLAHDPSVYITDVQPLARHLAIFVRRDGLARLWVMGLASRVVHEVEQVDAVCTVEEGDNRNFDTGVLRYEVSSMVTPGQDVDYDLEARTTTIVKQRPVLGGYDPTRFVTARIVAVAPDGTRIPISVAHRRGMPLDGSAAALLYGYGSYGVCYDPQFSITAVSLLERSMVVAIAHIRGGGDLGRAWYEAGKLANKQNTFTDFAACCQALCQHGFTSSDRLALSGGSAGGLLMGALVNQHPRRFTAVVARVPFVDVTTTMLDETLPLTVTEYEEWGNPNEPEAYRTIRAYSPYDNIEHGPKPAVLATGGLNDPRVGFWEPAKWVARLRDHNTGDSDILLHMHLGAGHGGPTGRYAHLEEIALIYAFVLDKVGLSEVSPSPGPPADP